MKKIHILQVSSSFQYGGTEAYIMNNLRYIDRDQFQFDFWISQPVASPYADEIKSLGSNIYYGQTLQSKLRFVSNLKKHINNVGSYDVVHSHINIANAWVMIAALIAGVRIRISHSHATTGRDTTNIIKKLYVKVEEYIIKAFATHKLACSNEAGNYLYGGNYFLKHGEVCKNGIDIDSFLYVNETEVNALKNEFHIPKDSFIIGNITRFESNKNQSFAVEVFKEILRIKPRSILILGGVDGGQLSYIKEKVRKSNIEDKVRFIGVRSDIHICLHMMDAYLFPSLSEGLGFALLEAQAVGLPCFTSLGISKEADIGLNLVHFIGLDKGQKYWAEYILDHYGKCEHNPIKICAAFDRLDYSIKSSIKKVMKIYSGE
jgi:glycosyltransferase EpsF